MADKTKDVELEEYNYFEYRKVKKPNSDIRSLANYIKSSFGVGILAVPLAFANAGWGIGIIGTCMTAFICGHSAHIFVQTSRACCKQAHKPSLTYAETCKFTFKYGPKCLRPYSNAAGIFADCSMIFAYMFACCTYNILIADTIKQIVDEYISDFPLDIKYYCMIVMLPLFVMVQIRYLKWLAPFSMVANILLVLTLCIIGYYIFKDEIIISDKTAIGPPSRYPVFLVTMLLAMEGIGMVMPVENNMKNPSHFLGCPSVLGVAMTLVTIFYTFIGLFGYLRYGDALRGSITLNLPIDEWPAICAKSFIALSLILSYPLQYFIVFEGYEKHIEPHIIKGNKNIIQVFVRIFIVILCGVLAIAIPILEEIINISGAVFYNTLGLIIPGILDIVVRYNNLGKFKWILWKDILIIFYGFFCLVCGLMITVQNILNKGNKNIV